MSFYEPLYIEYMEWNILIIYGQKLALCPPISGHGMSDSDFCHDQVISNSYKALWAMAIQIAKEVDHVTMTFDL